MTFAKELEKSIAKFSPRYCFCLGYFCQWLVNAGLKDDCFKIGIDHADHALDIIAKRHTSVVTVLGYIAKSSSVNVRLLWLRAGMTLCASQMHNGPEISDWKIYSYWNKIAPKGGELLAQEIIKYPNLVHDELLQAMTKI